MLASGNYGGAFGRLPFGHRELGWKIDFVQPSRAPREAATFFLRHKRRRQIMIKFQKPVAGGIAVGTLVTCMLALSAPAAARGGGGGGSSHGSHGPGRPPPPVFVDSSPAGRALGSGCSISRKPVTGASGNTVGYRRVQICNLD